MASLREQDPQIGHEREEGERRASSEGDPNLAFRIKEEKWKLAVQKGIWKGVWLAELIYPSEMIDVEKRVKFGD